MQLKHVWEGEAPSEPHLALVVDANGDSIAIPPGAKLFIVENPEKPDGIVPVFLVKVSRKQLVVRCNCGRPKCTRVGKYKATWTGFHPQE